MEEFQNFFFTICTWPNRPVAAKFLSGFQFEEKTYVWISQVRRVKDRHKRKKEEPLLRLGQENYPSSRCSSSSSLLEGLPKKKSFRHPLYTMEKVILALENTLLTVGGFCRKKSHEALKNLQHWPWFIIVKSCEELLQQEEGVFSWPSWSSGPSFFLSCLSSSFGDSYVSLWNL